MRLTNVDKKKPGAVLVLLVQAFQGISLTPEGWSRPASEDEHNRSLGLKLRETDRFAATARFECEIRGLISDRGCFAHHHRASGLPIGDAFFGRFGVHFGDPAFGVFVAVWYATDDGKKGNDESSVRRDAAAEQSRN